MSDGTVLVLNATYQPLSVVGPRRAILLVLGEKAELLAADPRRPIRSEKLTLATPDVVRLKRYVNVQRIRPVHLSRRGVLLRDEHRCAYCGHTHATTIDHVVPRSRGGRHEWSNVVAACQPCNGRKGDRLISELGWSLMATPRVPGPDWWIRSAATPVRPAWEPWIRAAA